LWNNSTADFFFASWAAGESRISYQPGIAGQAAKSVKSERELIYTVLNTVFTTLNQTYSWLEDL